MIWTDLALIALGLALHVLLRRRGARAWPAGLGTLLAVFATLTGFSIGVYITPIAALVLLWAALRALGSRDPNPNRSAE